MAQNFFWLPKEAWKMLRDGMDHLILSLFIYVNIYLVVYVCVQTNAIISTYP